MTRRVTGLLLVLLLALAEYQAVAVRIDRGRVQTHRLSHLLKGSRRFGAHSQLSALDSADLALGLGAALRPDETRRLTLMRDVIAKVIDPNTKPEGTVELFDELVALATGVPLSSPAIDPLQTELIALAERAAATAKTAYGSNKDAAPALTFADSLLGVLKKGAAAKTWSEELSAEAKALVDKTLTSLDPQGTLTDTGDAHPDALPLNPVSTFALHNHYGIPLPTGGQLVSVKTLLETAAQATAELEDAVAADASRFPRFRSSAGVRNGCANFFLAVAALAMILAFAAWHYPELTVPLTVVLVILVLFGGCFCNSLRSRQARHPSTHSGRDVPVSSLGGAKSGGGNTGVRRRALPTPPKPKPEFPPHTPDVLYYPVSVVIPFHGSLVTLTVNQNADRGCYIRVLTTGGGTVIDANVIAQLNRCEALATELGLPLPLALDQHWIASLQYNNGAVTPWGGNIVIPPPSQPNQVWPYHPTLMEDEMSPRTSIRPFVVTLAPLTRISARLRHRTGPAVTYHDGEQTCYTGLAAATLNNPLVLRCTVNALNPDVLNNAYVFTTADLVAPHANGDNLQGLVTINFYEPYPIAVAHYDATGVRASVITFVRHDVCTGLNQNCLTAIAAAPTFPGGVVLLPNGYSPMAYKNPWNNARFNMPLTWNGAAIPANELAAQRPTLTIEVLRTIANGPPPIASQAHFPGTLTTAMIAPRHGVALGIPATDNLRINTQNGGAGPVSEHVFYLNCASGRFADNDNNVRTTARNNAIAAIRVASGAALHLMTPDGLFNNINDNGLGGPAPSASRALKEALEVAHGAADTHFGYVYADIRVQIVGLIPSALRAEKQIGWMCAAENRPHGPLNVNSAIGAGVHTEQRCLEHLRRFIQLLEHEGNANRVARQVVGIRTRWFTDYTPDNAAEQHCAWAIAFTRFAAESGRWLDAAGEYDEVVRAMPHTQTACIGHLGAAVPNRVIAWAAPIGHCTYRDRPGIPQRDARDNAHLQARNAHRPSGVPTHVEETANTAAPPGSVGAYNTMLAWPLAP